jgi:acyl-coenzyme A thioesterase PaaI-like protein
MSLELPHTAGCLVCGPGNNKGLRLKLFVDPETGVVQTQFAPAKEHIGFEGVTHGGVLAAVLDEVMVWAATWSGKRFCLCGEMNVRFRQKAQIGVPLACSARVDLSRSKLISTTAEARNSAGRVVATATGKYIPVTREENREFVGTFVSEPATAAASEMMRSGV